MPERSIESNMWMYAHTVYQLVFTYFVRCLCIHMHVFCCSVCNNEADSTTSVMSSFMSPSCSEFRYDYVQS